MKPETRIQHLRVPQLGQDNVPLVTPVYHSVKYSLPSVGEIERLFGGDREGYFYSSLKNPTVTELETVLADLQGRQAAMCAATGTIAISSLLVSLVEPGDRGLMFLECYRPTRMLGKTILRRLGVDVHLASMDNADEWDPWIRENRPRFVIFEAPTNPTLEILDMSRLIAVARAVGASVVLDNTFAGLSAHRTFDVDFYVHSLTKYAAGHGDVMGGVIVADEAKLGPRRESLQKLGCYLDPGAAAQILRGLKTYFVRRQRMVASAMVIADELSADPRVTRLRYPGLRGSPRYDLAREQLEDFGTMIHLDLVGKDQGGVGLRHFLDSLRLFRVVASLGSTESLAAPSLLFYGGDLSEAERRQVGISDQSVRLSIGLEDPSDLLTDLRQALSS